MKRTIKTALLAIFATTLSLSAQNTQPFPEITVPAIYTDQTSYLDYYVAHYWDRYDFGSFDKKYSEETTGQAFANFAYVLGAQSGLGEATPQAVSAVKNMLSRAAVTEDAYWRFLDLCEHYFYEPNSPMRNDEFFLPALDHALSSKSPLDEASKERYRSLKKTVARNRPGSIATDFAYTTASGTQGRLHTLSSEILVVFFYNPGCADCRRVKELLTTSEAVDALHKSGRLKVLAVYPDKDLTEWKKYLPENPKWWISAYDKGTVIQNKGLYDLKAIPTLYLMDSNKRIALKDPTPENLLALLEML